MIRGSRITARPLRSTVRLADQQLWADIEGRLKGPSYPTFKPKLNLNENERYIEKN